MHSVFRVCIIPSAENVSSTTFWNHLEFVVFVLLAVPQTVPPALTREILTVRDARVRTGWLTNDVKTREYNKKWDTAQSVWPWRVRGHSFESYKYRFWVRRVQRLAGQSALFRRHRSNVVSVIFLKTSTFWFFFFYYSNDPSTRVVRFIIISNGFWKSRNSVLELRQCKFTK